MSRSARFGSNILKPDTQGEVRKREQCKEIEENNRMRKIIDLFKKMRDTKGILHAKMGTIKDRNGMGLTEAEDKILRGGKNTQKNYTK